ncbi:hypothetical protein AVEN_74549-1 [Araneus ventricosus]|uniref:Apple domain-containing protein n=1 Tax=Araneus ventricosus TaxID=182803 RepID=A0A4Y2GS84_ARAVE|nr:hypothetical protein AVEN_74549-1 [Araneus ventricosus]
MAQIRELFLVLCTVSFRSVAQIWAFEVTTTQFYFWFEDKVHDSWILESYEDSHMVTCLQKCRSDSNCTGLALGPIDNETETYSRTCHTLWDINEADCDEWEACKFEGFQVFHASILFYFLTLFV